MFDIDFNKKGQILLHIRKFLLYPYSWEDSSSQVNIPLTWDSLKFDVSNKALVPSKKGVYCFVVKPNALNFFETNYLFYIGETTRTLKIRFGEYLDDQAGKGKPRTKVFEMLKLYQNYLYFYFTEIKNDSDIHEVEEKLLNTFAPFINTKIPKAKIKPEFRNIYEA